MKKSHLAILILAFILVGCTNAGKRSKTEYLVIKGINLSQEGNYTQALKEFESAYKKDKKNLIVLRQMAYIYSNFGDYNKAKRYYNEVLLIEENDPFAVSNLAILYYKTGDYEKSLAEIQKLSPDSITAKIQKVRAFNYYQMGDYDKALYYFENMLSTTDYIDAEFTQKYVDTLKKKGNSNKGYMYLYEVYNKYNRALDVSLLYSEYVYSEFNDVNSAIDVLEKYTLNVDRNEAVFFKLANYYYLAENYKKSKLYLNLLSDKYKYHLDTLNLKIQVAEKLGEKEEVGRLQKTISNIKGQEK